jgi:YHS domain-containing protein
MYRLLLVTALLIVLYFLLRQILRGIRQPHIDERGPSIDHDQMVLDQVCQTFVPRRTALTKEIGGQLHYFCSNACLTAFEKRQSTSPT